jgi:hypothetical protein
MWLPGTSTNQSYHWKLNHSEVTISGRLANQIVRIEPIRRGVTCNTSAFEQYIRWQNHHWHYGTSLLWAGSWIRCCWSLHRQSLLGLWSPVAERCIDNIDTPSVQRRRPAILSRSCTTLHSMRWQRPPFHRWYGPCTDSRPQPSRLTCLLVLSCGTSRLECCVCFGWNFYVVHWSSTMYGQASEKA